MIINFAVFYIQRVIKILPLANFPTNNNLSYVISGENIFGKLDLTGNNKFMIDCGAKFSAVFEYKTKPIIVPITIYAMKFLKPRRC